MLAELRYRLVFFLFQWRWTRRFGLMLIDREEARAIEVRIIQELMKARSDDAN